jgi:hypothetical protein
LFEWRDKQRAYEAQKAQADKAKTEIEQYNKTVQEKSTTAFALATERHADFKEKALDPKLEIRWGSPVDEWILQLIIGDRPEIGTEMLYHFGTNREELKRINSLPRTSQHRELAKLEDTLSGTKTEEPPPPKEKAKVVTDALPPPKEVGGKGTAAEDEEEAALKANNVDRYIELANKRELAQRKKR